ncbi:30S ribosomal protein S17 [Candidatus Dependentiae bacterium]
MGDSVVKNKAIEGQRKALEGIVISDAMDKTIVVKVVRTYRHPFLGKTIRVAKKYHAHDENGQAKVGDTVRIEECRPLSKSKKTVLVNVVGAAEGLKDHDTERV